MPCGPGTVCAATQESRFNSFLDLVTNHSRQHTVQYRWNRDWAVRFESSSFGVAFRYKSDSPFPPMMSDRLLLRLVGRGQIKFQVKIFPKKRRRSESDANDGHFMLDRLCVPDRRFSRYSQRERQK